MQQKAISKYRVLKIPSALVFAIGALTICFSQTQSDTTKQPQVPPTQKTDFPVGRKPDAILFDGANIWVANQLGDSLMKLSASDGSNLGTFPTGSKPVALAYDGENIWVANKLSNNVMKLRASDGSLIETIKVGRGPEALLFDIFQQCLFQRVRIAHPAIHDLQLRNARLVLFRCVVAGVDVF